VLIHLLCCAAMFFIFMIFEYFWPNYRSHDLRSFSSITSVGLGARLSLIIYLQSWNETMVLPLQFDGFLPFLPKSRFFEFIQNRKESLWIWEKPHWKLITCVEVTLVSKFHPFWCPVAQELKLRRKFLGMLDISGSITGYICQNRTYPIQGWTCLSGSFSSNVYSLFWSYLANRVSNWSQSFSAVFITLRGSFLYYWLVCSLISCMVLTLGFELGTYASSCIRILIGSHSPPLWSPSPVLQLVCWCLCDAIVMMHMVWCKEVRRCNAVNFWWIE
jgi:hypothetical protein